MRVVIQKIRRQGASVALPQGIIAWLPAAELVADIRPGQDLRDVSPFKPGEVIDAVVYGEIIDERRRYHLVSHVRVQNDPWDQVDTWHTDTVKTMEVTLVTANRAIGIIDHGIRGQVLLGSLRPLFARLRGAFARLLPGDRVAGYVKRVPDDERQRILTLDVASLAQSPIKVTDVLCPALSVEATCIDVKPSSIARTDEWSSILKPIQRLLIVDDDTELTDSIRTSLHGKDCDVEVGSSETDGHWILKDAEDAPDLALLDVHIPGDSAATGLRLAASLQAEWPNLPIVLITGDDTFFENPSRYGWEDLLVRDVILKPLGFDQLLRALEARNKPPRRLDDFRPGGQIPVLVPSTTPDPPEEPLVGILRDLRGDLKAECVVLFSIHPLFGKVEIVARDDPDNLIPNVRPNIERSPVKDVAFEGEELSVADASDVRHIPKHRWLQRAYGYRSCLAVPVHVPSENAYAVFAFHRQKEHFAQHRLPRMRLAAREIASILHVQRVEKRLREMQPYELLGRAYGSMAHDLRGSLSVEFLTERLLILLQEQTPLTAEDLDELREKIETLHVKLRRAAEIVRTFRQVARSGHEVEQEVDLLTVVPAFVKEVAAQESLVHPDVVITGLPNAGYRVRIRPTGVQQVIFNLLLNATQQIEQFPLREKAWGSVMVELGHEVRDGRLWVCIRVHDNGPGVHAADFSRIFDLGYSTKDDGFGMGLDICRQMAKDVRIANLCGEVRVRTSILLVGTTFELCIPTENHY